MSLRVQQTRKRSQLHQTSRASRSSTQRTTAPRLPQSFRNSHLQSSVRKTQMKPGCLPSYYWIMPIAKFVQLFGLDHYDESIKAIEEITKRNTGEYAIRPFIEKYPQKTLKIMTKWAKSKNFHLRRLASEGLRPKLPWAPKLDAFNDSPEPVFELLELLKEDDIKFVKKSVANHLRDWTKVNPDKANPLLDQWAKSDNPHTQWIVKHARR
jgi:3-methyladenine DNA glycosylase AlkC